MSDTENTTTRRGRPRLTAEQKKENWNAYQRKYYAKKRDLYKEFQGVERDDIHRLITEIDNLRSRLDETTRSLNDAKVLIKDLVEENNKLKIICVKQKQHILKNRI